jgi:putative transposase
MPSSFQQLESTMEKVRRRRYGAETWQNILGRFEESGLDAPAFCTRERVSMPSFRRWQKRLGGESDRAVVARAAEMTGKPAGFIDLGDLRAGDARFEVRLELGGGIVLSLARG